MLHGLPGSFKTRKMLYTMMQKKRTCVLQRVRPDHQERLLERVGIPHRHHLLYAYQVRYLRTKDVVDAGGVCLLKKETTAVYNVTNGVRIHLTNKNLQMQ